jgi:hypothetical protein
LEHPFKIEFAIFNQRLRKAIIVLAFAGALNLNRD